MTADRPPRVQRRSVWLIAYLALLGVLIAGSNLRRVGDGGQYLEMAESLARFDAPLVHSHFWFYSALNVVPLWAVRSLSLDPFAAFVPLNLALLAVAFWIAAPFLRWPALLLLFVSPIVWWVDKAHTEIFSFTMLVIALVAMRPSTPRILHPGWALVCLALAGTQNPPFLPLMGLAGLLLIATRIARLDDRAFLTYCAVAFLLAMLHPVYYFMVRGEPSGLTRAVHGGIPNIDELLAVVKDSNIGIVANAPVLVLASLFAVAIATVEARRRLFTADTALAMLAVPLFLISFSQAENQEHGGTPGMSRYALWLIPLLLPFLRAWSEESSPVVLERLFVPLVLASCVWSVVAFHPRLPQYGPRQPSWLATWLWTNYPGLDRPLPEVFVERLRPGTPRLRLPTATSDCRKILLLGQGETTSIWPIPCYPSRVSEECLRTDALCYANREGAGYRFSRVPAPSAATFRFDDQDVWTDPESQTARDLLDQLRWWEMEICSVSINRVARGQFGVGGPDHYCAPDRLLAYFRNGDDLRIRMRLRQAMSGALVDATTGQIVARVDGIQPGELSELPIPAGPASVFLVLTTSGWP